MKKKLVKVFTILFVILLIIVFIQNISIAAVTSSDVKIFTGADETATSGGTAITNILGMVLTVVRTVAIGISIIMITYLGIRYMSAAPTEKANIKNQLITFVIGSAFVIGAVSLFGIIRNLATTITTST